MEFIWKLLHKKAQRDFPDIVEISAEDLNQKSDEAPETAPCILLDVRTKQEWDGGHIPGALHVPLDQLEEKAESILTDKSWQVVCYCRSGVRSLKAAHLLKQKGYQHLYSLGGGIVEWAEKDFPIAH